jgi:hypothetical protein
MLDCALEKACTAKSENTGYPVEQLPTVNRQVDAAITRTVMPSTMQAAIIAARGRSSQINGIYPFHSRLAATGPQPPNKAEGWYLSNGNTTEYPVQYQR